MAEDGLVTGDIAGWLIDAADLLAEPDPGPTPWLVEGLIVDQALTAVVGKWKTTKSWAMLDLAVSIATGTPAFGTVEIPEPGPVVYVIEESGRARALAAPRRALPRPRDPPRALRGRLLLAPNQRVKLDDAGLAGTARRDRPEIRPRAFIFDPLARMKDADREENDQTGDGAADRVPPRATRRDGGRARSSSTTPDTRATTCAAPPTSSPPGSPGSRSSATARTARHGQAEHREEEPGAAVMYRIDWDPRPARMRLRPTVPPLAERIIDHLDEHGPMGPPTSRGASKRGAQTSTGHSCQLEAAGTTRRAPSGKRDGMGRLNPAKVWHLNSHAASRPSRNPD